jgi:hypothetical protein
VGVGYRGGGGVGGGGGGGGGGGTLFHLFAKLLVSHNKMYNAELIYIHKGIERCLIKYMEILNFKFVNRNFTCELET